METDTNIRTEEKIDGVPPEFAHIKGWGVDADRRNNPTYPIKKYTGDDHRHLNYKRPSLQTINEEVLKSNERPVMTAVFGTPVPPSGLSGLLRRFAFKFSEGKWWHWLALIAADRVNVVEGLVEDVRSGRIPNIPAERGIKAAWKYDRKRVLRNATAIVIIGSAIGAAIAVYRRRRAYN
jgi:hypothetical protein